jgi:hypothetical protein
VPERLAEAAAALVRRPVDVIATFGTPASFAATSPVSMGLVVDMAKRTVHGFREQFVRDGHETELKITEVKEAILVLRGPTGSTGVSVSGFMDRMSGDMTVTVSQEPPAAFTKTYTLKCRPAQWMF